MKNFDNEMRIFSLIFSVFIIELVSFYFNISGGPTAVMSAIVVSQSFVGAQYLKARNRIIGTILGIMASFISAYLYVGNELYFIVFSMLWISFMSVMISLVPTDNSHLFQLGANTYAFVALPLILSPEETYFNLITRSTGVFMGVVILVVTSVLMLLKRSDYDFKKNMRGIFRKTIRINKKVAEANNIERKEIKNLFTDISTLISNKRNIVYEHGLGFKSKGALKTFSILSMMLFLYSNTLRHYLKNEGEKLADIKSDFLNIIKKSLMCRADINKFDHSKIKISNIFLEHKSALEAVIRGIRAFTITGILLITWYITGWSGGHVMVSLGVVYMILLTTYPAPVAGGKHMVYGTILGMIVGWIYIQTIYSSQYTFISPSIFFIAQLPVLIIGSRFLFVGKTFLLGVTFLTTFYFGLQPSNTSVVSYETFMDNSLGATVGLIITGLGISIIFPEKKRIKNEKLIKATIKELVYALKKKNLNMSNVVRHTHDRLRLSDSLEKCTSDDFLVLTNLSSLFIIFHYIFEYKKNSEFITIIDKQLNKWLETNMFMMENETLDDLEELISNETGEVHKLSMCAYGILLELKDIYEK